MRSNRYCRLIRGFIAISLLTTLVSLTAIAQAASGNGPYYAEPAWSQKLPASTRFVVLTDWNSEAVLDCNTGLVWEKSPNTATATWRNAVFVCINKNVGGQKGWRLPAIVELASLIDPLVSPPGPTLPSGHPFVNVQSVDYWSATPSAEDSAFAWVVDFGIGNVGFGTKTVGFHAWCVRGGSIADAY